MLLTQRTLQTIHGYCTRNRRLMEESSTAGCFSCGETFTASDVREWVRERDAATGAPDGETAKCPRCGFGAVLPSAAPVALTPELFRAMQSFWFKGIH